MAQHRQPTFSAGEIAPYLQGRTDVAKHHHALARCRNFIVTPEGNVTNRPGFMYCGSAMGQASRLIPFIFGDAVGSQTQNYVIELGINKLRIWLGGGRVMDPLSPTDPLEVETPWSMDQLAQVKYAQSGDILWLCHPAFSPRELRRMAHDEWVLTTMVVGATTSAPTNLHFNPPPFTPDATHVGKPWDYVVTAVTGGDNPEESLPSSVLSHSSTTPGSIPVYPDFIVGLVWDSVTDAVGYNVYRGQNGKYGFIGSTGPGQTQFTDEGQVPTYSEPPPQNRDPFSVSPPAVVSFAGQRSWFANSGPAPVAIWSSKIGALRNFDRAEPAKVDDAITAYLAMRRFEEIRWMMPLNKLLIGTSGSEWTLDGVSGEPPTPQSLDLRVRSHFGSSWLDPVVVGNVVLYVTNMESHVRELLYAQDSDAYGGNDLSLLASHLFAGHTIVDWAYTRTPLQTIWLVRDDGVLLSLSYLRELEQVAWAWHDTAGQVKSVCSVPEGIEDALYLNVQRASGRFIERMATREVSDARWGVFLDGSLFYDGEAYDESMPITLLGQSPRQGATVTVYNHGTTIFHPDDVGDVIELDPRAEGGGVRVLITSFTDATTVEGVLLDDASGFPELFVTEFGVPPAGKGTRYYAWARTIFADLPFSDGTAVTVLADGKVTGPYAVSGSQITLDEPATHVIIGLPYYSELELLDLATKDDAKRASPKLVSKVSFEVVDATPTLEAGETLDRLTRWQAPPDVSVGADGLLTGLCQVQIESAWNTRGRAVLRQADPLPCTVVAAIREVADGE